MAKIKYCAVTEKQLKILDRVKKVKRSLLAKQREKVNFVRKSEIFEFKYLASATRPRTSGTKITFAEMLIHYIKDCNANN